MTMAHAYFWDLDFSLHVALLRGNQLPTQSGSYLKDSFRMDVVLPAVQKIVETLKHQRRANILHDLFLFLLSVVTSLVMAIGYYMTKGKRNGECNTLAKGENMV